MAKEKPLSPRRIASYCQVNFKTVLRWIAEGRLRAYQLPGGSNRVTRSDLIDFLKDHNMPIPHELEPHAGRRVQVISVEDTFISEIEEPFAEGAYDVRCSTDGFDAGYDYVTYRPNAIILDMTMSTIDPHKVAQQIKEYASKCTDDYSPVLTCVAPGFSVEARSMLNTIGVDILIEHPYTSSDILKKVSSYLR